MPAYMFIVKGAQVIDDLHAQQTSSSLGHFLIALVILAAWVFLAIMTIAWISNHRLPKYIPIVASTIGLPCAIFVTFFTFGTGLIFYTTATLLAFHLDSVD